MPACKAVFVLMAMCIGLSVQDDLKVSVYYESLCPDSVKFITKQFYPTYTAINSLFSVELIPYGKATQHQVDGKWVFQCQHGPNECYGNKIQACVLKQDIDFDKKISFVNCIMDSNDPSEPQNVEQCAIDIGFSWEPIRTCTINAIGDKYLAELGDRTHAVKPHISYVPTIIYNDTYDSDLQWQSIKNFKGVVCKLQGNPGICNIVVSN